MTLKERKHQYYLAHRAEYLERSQRWSETHRKQKSESVQRSKAKRIANMTPAELQAYKDLQTAKRLARRKALYDAETPEQREARRAELRAKQTERRRKAGIGPRQPKMDADEHRRRAREANRKYYYARHASDEARLRYERERKRAYRERKKHEQF